MLEVKDATIAIGEHLLVEHLSFTARDGQLTCVTGPEGSGKTTLLRVLMGLLPVGSGFVSIDGELLTPRSVRAFRGMMVYLPQHLERLTHQLLPPQAPIDRRISGTLLEPHLPLYDYSLYDDSLLPKADRLEEVEPLSPEDTLQLILRTLDEGREKPIIVADEPAAHLTAELTRRLIDRLREEARQGKTVLLASRRSEITSQADQLIEICRPTS